MNCTEALRILTLPTHQERDAAVDYILSHPTCLARVEQLRRAITLYPADEPTCADVQSQFADYFAQETDHGNGASVYPELATHLGHCPFCQIEYSVLQKTMAKLADGTLAPGSENVQFDLSFLEEEEKLAVESANLSAPIWQINGKLHQLVQTLKIALSETSARIESVFPSITPQLHLQPMRGQDDIRYSVITLPDEIGHLRFQLECKPAAFQTAHVLLTLFDTITNQPGANLRVALRKSDGTMIISSLTDDWGRFELPQMALNSYVLHVRTDEGNWEIPIAIEEATSSLTPS